MSLLSILHISHVILKLESLLLTLSQKMFAGNQCYESPSTLGQNNVITLLSLFFHLEHISHHVPVLLMLISSMYLIAEFDISYFSRFEITIYSSFIVYSFLERISTKCNGNPLASSSKQVFIPNFHANCNVNYFLSSLSLINKIILCLTRGINSTCKNSHY